MHIKKRDGRKRPSRQTYSKLERLDNVDLSWEIARNFETNFLLANLRFIPNLHFSFPPKVSHKPLCFPIIFMDTSENERKSCFLIASI
ncbi:protein of unknown function [Candidatus Filomicrobium marinum]|uniref:Uncharacterized protein n=1 Tax=Candidatus Filomicrobium marinum TaxID=1608628 RepID=A0A0D6JJW4_9HYPH|nr:protein of unknown function [Candidatus Filomicrobium marinum]CPR21972.1 protein of unknown function [Candidatus Filomicrobium marinum]